MSQKIQVRKIMPGDTTAVHAFVDSIMSDEFPGDDRAFVYYDLDNPAEAYGGKRDLFLVAEVDGEIAGTVAVKEDSDDTALLRRLFVRGDLRGRGLGARLLRDALKFAANHGYRWVTFRGTDRMRGALSLCGKHGFHTRDTVELGGAKLVVLSRDLKTMPEVPAA